MKNSILHVKFGSAEGVSFRIAIEEQKDNWTRVIIISGGDTPEGKRYRYFELVPGDDVNRIEHHGFFVKGRFRVARKLNNSKKALNAWKAFDERDPET